MDSCTPEPQHLQVLHTLPSDKAGQLDGCERDAAEVVGAVLQASLRFPVQKENFEAAEAYFTGICGKNGGETGLRAKRVGKKTRKMSKSPQTKVLELEVGTAGGGHRVGRSKLGPEIAPHAHNEPRQKLQATCSLLFSPVNVVISTLLLAHVLKIGAPLVRLAPRPTNATCSTLSAASVFVPESAEWQQWRCASGQPADHAAGSDSTLADQGAWCFTAWRAVPQASGKDFETIRRVQFSGREAQPYVGSG